MNSSLSWRFEPYLHGLLPCTGVDPCSEEDALAKWVAAVNEFGERERDITKVLKHATATFAAMGLGDEVDASGRHTLFTPSD